MPLWRGYQWRLSAQMGIAGTSNDKYLHVLTNLGGILSSRVCQNTVKHSFVTHLSLILFRAIIKNPLVGRYHHIHWVLCRRECMQPCRNSFLLILLPRAKDIFLVGIFLWLDDPEYLWLVPKYTSNKLFLNDLIPDKATLRELSVIETPVRWSLFNGGSSRHRLDPPWLVAHQYSDGMPHGCCVYISMLSRDWKERSLEIHTGAGVATSQIAGSAWFCGSVHVDDDTGQIIRSKIVSDPWWWWC